MRAKRPQGVELLVTGQRDRALVIEQGLMAGVGQIDNAKTAMLQRDVRHPIPKLPLSSGP